MDTFLSFLVSPPRKLQIQKVAERWHSLIARTLNTTEDLIIIMPLQPSYELQSTIQPKQYSGSELKELEKERYFILTPAQNSKDEVILCLTNGSCCINLFSRTDGISMIERKSLQRLNLKLTLQFRVYEFTLSSNTTLRMIKPDRLIDSYSFEPKEQTMYRKSLQVEELKIQESEKNGEVISNAVSSSMLACMQKYLQVQAQQAEQERLRRIEQDKILQSIKQEKERGERENLLLLNTPQQRGRRGSMDSQIGFGANYNLPRMETETVMGSHQPFGFHIPTNLTPLPRLNPLPPLHTISGVSVPPPIPQVPSVRSRTSEQQSAIQSVSDRIQGARPISNRSEANEGSVAISEPVQVQLAKDKIKHYLNELAGNEDFRDVNFPEILKQMIVKSHENEEY